MSDPDFTIHELKTWPRFFDEIKSGAKTFEIRENDRGYAVGDLLHLREYDPGKQQFSGRETFVRVTYITDWQQRPGTVVMAIVPATHSPRRPS